MRQTQNYLKGSNKIVISSEFFFANRQWKEVEIEFLYLLA